MRVAESAGEFQAKQEREFEPLATLILMAQANALY